MPRCYAYIRTSTIKQGTEGVSLEAQRDAISAYAQRQKLTIVEWFSETQTAAKRGRPIFAKMMKQLGKRKVDGLILHRIDRGSRNLKDWSDIADLSDIGLEIHFAHDSIDLNTRGGRLAADVQAVVAADFIRNLREETKKGMLGRLKQGYYPLGAPVGYVNNGRAKAKTIDPIKGPLVRNTFLLYATGKYSFKTLRKEMFEQGLRTPQGKPISLQGLTTMLNNPFYFGLMRLRSTGETFKGLHEPLIPQVLFDRVQDVLHGRVAHRGLTHDHLYRRDVVCSSCTYKLIGESQKIYVYYRCHQQECPKTSLREEAITKAMIGDLKYLQCVVDTYPELEPCLTEGIAKLVAEKEDRIAAVGLKQVQLAARLNALTDAMIEGLIDKDSYIERKNAVLSERVQFEEIVASHMSNDPPEAKNARRYLELAKQLRSGLFEKSPVVARGICKTITSNFCASGKSVVLQWTWPFDHLVEHGKMLMCDPATYTHRTFEELVEILLPSTTSPHPHVSITKR